MPGDCTYVLLREIDNILLEFTDQFMQSFTEEHYASVVYVNPNNVSDSFKRVHVDIITKTSRANTFMTYVRHMLRVDDETLEPCMKHTRFAANRLCHFTKHDQPTSYNVCRSRTLYLIPYLDGSVLEWMKNLTTNQLNHCSWLVQIEYQSLLEITFMLQRFNTMPG